MGNPLLTRKQLDAVSINDFDLHEEMVNFPGELAYWNAQYARATEKYLLEKHEFEIVRSEVYLSLKEQGNSDAKKNKTKPPTIDDLKSMLVADKEYQDAHLAFIEAEIEREKRKRFAEAIVAKGDMLRSLGAKLREEMKGDPSVRRDHAYERTRQDEDDDI